MAPPEKVHRLGVDFLVIVLFGSAFLAAFAVVTSPPVLAESGDPIIWGRVTDNATSDPIPNALVHIQSNTGGYLNETFTNATGGYSVNVPTGDFLFAVANGSYYLYIEPSVIISGDVEKNVSLDPAPSRTARVKGYVTDNETSDPIYPGMMLALTPPMAMPVYVNYSFLNVSGYYEMAIIPGEYAVQSQVDGYLMNQTGFIVGSGETYWANMSLDPLPPENSLIQGYVWEDGTGEPIVGAFVSVDFYGSSNSTFTNDTGYYAMNVSAGDMRLRASASMYGAEERFLSVAANETRWENFTLLPTNSTVKGYITDKSTGLGIDAASVMASDMGNYTNFTFTDTSGYYEMQTIAGTLILMASRTGYLSNLSFFSIADGETLWINLTLRPEDAVLKGFVDEVGTGIPLGGVSVELGEPPFSFNSTMSSGTGYFEIGFVSGPAPLNAYLPGYQFFQADLDLAPGENWFNFTMYPELPANATLQGYVNDTFGSISFAEVRAEGYGTWSNQTFTDGTGFYAMNVVPANLTLFTRAGGHAPNWTAFSIAGGETLWLNVTLDIDTTPPNVTAFDVDPAVNVSANNPTTGTATINETWLDQTDLAIFSLRNESAFQRNFTLLGMIPETDYSLVESSPGIWDLAFSWDAKIAGGRMGNASEREWVPLPFFGTPLPWNIVFGQYRNASSPVPIGAQAFFSQSTGALELMGFVGPPESPPDDPTGEFQVLFLVYTLNATTDMIEGVSQVNGTWFAVPDLDFIRDDLVGSGTWGFWLQTQDYGFNWDQRWTFLDVDNTPPVADAGTDQAPIRTTTVDFDGTSSTDNVGITNYTWTFEGGSTVTLYGPTPSHTFNTVGDFEVTLKVTDGGMNTNTDTMWVNVTLDSEPPIADAGPDQIVDEGSMVTFDGSGSTDNIDIENYTWDFTDVTPQTLYEVSPTYLFVNPGTFVITLTVTDLDSNTDTDTVTITVNDTTDPIADAGPDQTVDEDTLVTFDGSGSSDNVAVTNYTWTFTDGTPQTLYEVAPTYTFAEPGTYVVTLTVQDDASNSDTDTVTITVLDVTPPIADAGPDQTVDEDTLVTFDGSGSSDNVGVINYTWTFQDGEAVTLYEVAPTYTFAEPGTYIVTLTVTDAASHTDTDTITITVRDVTDPVADAGADKTVVEDVEVDFDGTDSTDNVGIDNYTWDFDDGSVGYGATPTHAFSDPGDYTVTLTVRDAAGNEATDSLTVTVQLDTDGDETPDATDDDDDDDGMPDIWEVDNGFDPLDPADAVEDPDGDGVTNLDEYAAGSDPNRANWMDLVIYGAIAAAVGAAAIVGFLVWRRGRKPPTTPPKETAPPQEQPPPPPEDEPKQADDAIDELLNWEEL